MERRAFERKPLGSVELDLCFACHAIWFDQYESAQLTPGAVVQLFGQIHAHESSPPRPLGGNLRCPGCAKALALTQDVQRTNRISYYRCVAGHGRLTTFFQFLREKNFVRSLSLREIENLKATVKQVRCSSCGAPVSLERDAQCGYCRAPVSILDADAVKTTLAELTEAERKRNHVDPSAALDAVLAAERHKRRSPSVRTSVSGNTTDAVDLVCDALGLLFD